MLLAALGAACTSAFCAEAEETVSIGVIAPLTGSNASRGIEISRTIAVFQGLLRNRKTKYDYRFVIDDGKCGLGGSATTISQKFINVDHVKFIVTGCSGETIQAGLIAEKAQVLTVGVLASDPAVRNLGDYVFRTYPDLERGIKEISRNMTAAGHQRIAVLTEDLPFTLSIEKMLHENLGQLVVFREQYATETNDFLALLTKLRALKPSALYFNCASAQTLANLVNQSRALGLNQPVFSYFVAGERQFLDAAGANSEELIFVDAPQIENASPEYAEFLARYRAEYPDGPAIEFLTRTTHDALQALTTAIEAVGPDAAAAKNYFYKIQFSGALGDVAFDAKGDVLGLDFVLKQIKNGKPSSLNSAGLLGQASE